MVGKPLKVMYWPIEK